MDHERPHRITSRKSRAYDDSLKTAITVQAAMSRRDKCTTIQHPDLGDTDIQMVIGKHVHG